MLRHDRPSLAVESADIPSIHLAQGLSSTSHFEKTRYGSVSAIHLEFTSDTECSLESILLADFVSREPVETLHRSSRIR